MSEKSEALRLADELEAPVGTQSTYSAMHQAAAELRFLHEKCEALTADTIEEMGRIVEIRRLTAQRDALLEALKEIVAATDSDEWNPVSTVKARAAIKMAEEGE